MNSQRRQQERAELRARLNLLVDEIDTVVQAMINDYRSDDLFDEDDPPMAMPQDQPQQQQLQWPMEPELPQQQQQWIIGPQLPQEWEIVPYQASSPQQQQQQWIEAEGELPQQHQQQQQPEWDEGWAPLSPAALAHMIQHEMDGLRQDLMSERFGRMGRPQPTWPGYQRPIMVGNMDHQQPQQQQQPWETPRTHLTQAEAPAPPPPSTDGHAQRAPVGELIFSDRCLLCMGQHGVDCAVVVRGNACNCVTICDACSTNGWWEQYCEAMRVQAVRQVIDSEDPWTGRVRDDPESIRRWVEGHDGRPKCLGCQACRIDYLIQVVRPRRSTRARARRQECAFCQ